MKEEGWPGFGVGWFLATLKPLLALGGDLVVICKRVARELE
jgi:hypothetical protein